MVPPPCGPPGPGAPRSIAQPAAMIKAASRFMHTSGPRTMSRSPAHCKCRRRNRAVQGIVPAVLELDAVAHRFGRLGPLSLRVAEGETLVVLGPSGSGKTTLLRLLLGLLHPEQGTVRFRGEDLRTLDPAALRRQIGYVVQGGGLFPHLTGEGNVTLVARFLKWPAERIARRVTELCRLAQLPSDALARY